MRLIYFSYTRNKIEKNKLQTKTTIKRRKKQQRKYYTYEVWKSEFNVQQGHYLCFLNNSKSFNWAFSNWCSFRNLSSWESMKVISFLRRWIQLSNKAVASLSPTPPQILTLAWSAWDITRISCGLANSTTMLSCRQNNSLTLHLDIWYSTTKEKSDDCYHQTNESTYEGKSPCINFENTSDRGKLTQSVHTKEMKYFENTFPFLLISRIILQEC